MTSSERIGFLMFRYGRNELSDAEEKELTVWRNTHPDNEAFFYPPQTLNIYVLVSGICMI